MADVNYQVVDSERVEGIIPAYGITLKGQEIPELSQRTLALKEEKQLPS